MGLALLLKGTIERAEGRSEAAVATRERHLELPPLPYPLTIFGLAASIWELGVQGAFDVAEKLLQRLSHLIEQLGTKDIKQTGLLAMGHAWYLEFQGMASLALARAQVAQTALTESEDLRGTSFAQASIGHCLFLQGRYKEACHELKEGLAIGPESGPVWGHGTDAVRRSRSRVSFMPNRCMP